MFKLGSRKTKYEFAASGKTIQPTSNNKTCTESKFQNIGWIYWKLVPFLPL